MPRSPQLTSPEIAQLRAAGLTQKEIAELLDVSEQAVSKHMHLYDVGLSPRQRAARYYPWQVPAGMQQAPYKITRHHAEYMVTGGKGMSEDKLKRLRSWYTKLRHENVVLEFDPAIPPITGVSRGGGFAYRPRLPEDGEMIIRVNEYTTLTPEGKNIWTFPPREP
ncbi:helix-turn-helix domain-containing protein [Nocardia cyriacigeorgica]|uniref:helix-turn-helix domain-containing protein n=1 Tax=Nocardia cyriacigeorgica TaxID=135487 RepID=UPI003CC7DBDD